MRRYEYHCHKDDCRTARLTVLNPIVWISVVPCVGDSRKVKKFDEID
jgi:hypothetical protein